MIMPDRIELVWWRTCLKLKQYSVWNCSPENPIDHVWDMLGRRIAARPKPPATVLDCNSGTVFPKSLIDKL
ncbi:hypothetical protein TNCV_89402 [Trichonephila clavipes]|nr:hypothetical protein TNCV_89402 [Trichonephila clavipes]